MYPTCSQLYPQIHWFNNMDTPINSLPCTQHAANCTPRSAGLITQILHLAEEQQKVSLSFILVSLSSRTWFSEKLLWDGDNYFVIFSRNCFSGLGDGINPGNVCCKFSLVGGGCWIFSPHCSLPLTFTFFYTGLSFQWNLVFLEILMRWRHKYFVIFSSIFALDKKDLAKYLTMEKLQRPFTMSSGDEGGTA